MSQKIRELMQQHPSSHNVLWLQQALQAAIELELATLPPYLCGLWAMTDPESLYVDLIYDIIYDEMSHFGLACNLLAATQGLPKIVGGYRDNIVYPGPLPGGVKPKCDPKFFDCDQNFEVNLGFDDLKSFAKMCMQIEMPEDPVPTKQLMASLAVKDTYQKTYPSIGEFYTVVLNAFEKNNASIPYATNKQLQHRGRPEMFLIDGLDAATSAINVIKHQGEGTHMKPYKDDGQPAHFYAFGEIYHGRKYLYHAKSATGNWNGDAIETPFPPPLLPMTPVPEGGYPSPPPSVAGDLKACDQNFVEMLQSLEGAWASGNPKALRQSFVSMDNLADSAKTLLYKRIKRNDEREGIYGPQFKII